MLGQSWPETLAVEAQQKSLALAVAKTHLLATKVGEKEYKQQELQLQLLLMPLQWPKEELQLQALLMPVQWPQEQLQLPPPLVEEWLQTLANCTAALEGMLQAAA